MSCSIVSCHLLTIAQKVKTYNMMRAKISMNMKPFLISPTKLEVIYYNGKELAPLDNFDLSNTTYLREYLHSAEVGRETYRKDLFRVFDWHQGQSIRGKVLRTIFQNK